MSAVPTNPKTVRALCQGCGHEGEMAVLSKGWLKSDVRPVGLIPDWCTCRPKKLGGPYVAPKGYVAKFTFGGGR